MVEASGGNDGERGIGYEREKDTPPELMTCSEMRKETEIVKTCFKIALSQGCPVCSQLWCANKSISGLAMLLQRVNC